MITKNQWLKSVVILLLWNLLVSSTAYASNRIVSLDLCTDWMLIQYADPSQSIVYSPLLYQNPPYWVPQGLAVHDGSLETILQLQPDTVLTGEFNAVTLRKRLQQLNIPVVVLPMPQTLASIRQYSEIFASAVSTSRDLMSNQKHPLHDPQDQTVLLIGANGIGTGRQTLEHEVVEAAGLKNYLGQSGFVALDLEQLVTHPPHHILLTGQYRNSTSLSNLFNRHAVLQRIINEQIDLNQQFWRWQCPGPWTLELVELLAGHLSQ